MMPLTSSWFLAQWRNWTIIILYYETGNGLDMLTNQ
jgi:hypothetical protein